MSIATALFTDSQIRIFRWLFGQPSREFHLNELRRLSGLGSASLQRELKRLTDAGLVHSERVGNLRRFQAGRELRNRVDARTGLALHADADTPGVGR